MQKLPVFGIIGQAYAFVWQQRNQFWALAVPAIIIVAIFTAILVSAISLFGDPADLEISSLFGAEATLASLYGRSLRGLLICWSILPFSLCIQSLGTVYF